MPSMQVVIECSSPVINYDSRWSSGTSATDDLANQYTASSFILTQQSGAQATFLFNGTSVAVVGAKRGNHGRYQGQVDNIQTSLQVGNGNSATSIFNATLFSWDGAPGLHTLTFENLDPQFLDIDYIAYTTSIGSNDEPLITDTYQESNPAFSFTPSTSWAPPPFPGTFSGGSGMVTSDPNAVATLKFIGTIFPLSISPSPAHGDGISLHGHVGTGFLVSYTVQMDNGPIALFQPPPIAGNVTTPREVLYIASGLGSGTHTMTVRLAQPPPAGEVLAIDFADVFTTASIGSSLTSSAVSPSSSNTPGGNGTNNNNAASQNAGITASEARNLKIGLGITSAIAGLAIAYIIYSFFAARRRRNDAYLAKNQPGNGFVAPNMSSSAAPGAPVPYVNALNGAAQPNGTNVLSPNMVSSGLSYTTGSNGAISPVSNPPHQGHHRGQESLSAGSTSAYGGVASTTTGSDSEPVVQLSRQDVKRQLVAHNANAGGGVQAPPAYSATGAGDR